MFKKILIANRGEIAVRVIRTCKKLGIGTVSVYSDADRFAPHVQMADEAVRIGTPPSAESYLLMDRIVDACKSTGAEAVHPGYGFLSENAQFANALKQNGIVFIGPGIHAIEVMGDKIQSKALAEESSVNVIPGFTGVLADDNHAVEVAGEIGYPVMLKASAGGGGKGMRIARNEQECREGFERASSEARSSFGDDRIFIEKYITNPRHIEIQVLADGYGNSIHLGERECSIQRRHQKVVEEAPSPFVSEELRVEMGRQALELARAVQYQSAGTVEFIVDANGGFYFLEMNTRLQVEHPITELVTGVDLVEQMIRIAAGERLELSQDDISMNGWALEARVYAEDAERGFLPSIGRLIRYREPNGSEVRVDAGVIEGTEISMFYDPMISKLITHGDSRLQALANMTVALDDYLIEGVTSNIPFLQSLMVHPRFVSGDLTTDFIANEYPDGYVRATPNLTTSRMFIVAGAVAAAIEQHRNLGISGQIAEQKDRVDNDFNFFASDLQDDVTDSEPMPVRVQRRDARWIVSFDQNEVEVSTDWWPGEPQFRANVDGDDLMPEKFTVTLRRIATGYAMTCRGTSAALAVMSPKLTELSHFMIEKPVPDRSQFLVSPMPGLLLSVAVKPGQAVKVGDELAVVEAMKMENVLTAERDAVVDEILVDIGSSLSVDQAIVTFMP